MADNKTVLHVDLVKNSNQKSDNFGRYYGRAVHTQTLSTRALANHIAAHNTVFGREVIEGVLIKFSECIPELVSQGIGVKLDGLGTFYPTIEGTASATVEAGVQNMTENIKGVHLRFRPEGVKGEDLRSRALKEGCVFEAYQLVKSVTKVIDGKKKTYQERTPLSTYAISQAEPDEP